MTMSVPDRCRLILLQIAHTGIGFVSLCLANFDLKSFQPRESCLKLSTPAKTIPE